MRWDFSGLSICGSRLHLSWPSEKDERSPGWLQLQERRYHSVFFLYDITFTKRSLFFWKRLSTVCYLVSYMTIVGRGQGASIGISECSPNRIWHQSTLMFCINFQTDGNHNLPWFRNVQILICLYLSFSLNILQICLGLGLSSNKNLRTVLVDINNP